MKNWSFHICILLIVLAAQIICLGQSQPQKAAAITNPTPTADRAASNSAPASENEPQFQKRDTRYKIAPGDSFDITFDLSPEFNQTGVAVQPDGFVTLHGVGDVKVQGQTVPQLTETLRKVYGKILNDPRFPLY